MSVRLWVGRVVSLATFVAAVSCGGSSGGASGGGNIPTAPTASGPTTIAVTGTTRQNSVNGCEGDSHMFNAAEGEIRITLTATSDTNQALSVQVCSGSNDTSTNCAVRQQKIAVGQTLTGNRVGGTAQLLKFLPYNCVFGNTFDPVAITYSGSLTFQQ